MGRRRLLAGSSLHQNVPPRVRASSWGEIMLLSLAHHYVELIAAGGRTYRARASRAVDADARWGGWIIFFPVGGGRAIASGRETTQSSLANLTHWASGLTPTYMEGALARALALTPEAQMAREARASGAARGVRRSARRNVRGRCCGGTWRSGAGRGGPRASRRGVSGYGSRGGRA